MNKKEAIDLLHIKKGFSRRVSAKLVDMALLEKDTSFLEALRKSIEKDLEKSQKIKYIIRN